VLGNMNEKLKCPLCGRYMIWVQKTLLCPKCDEQIIWDLNPDTICKDYEKKYKRKEK
jgi:predicted RNA-binding Zn-ribbon protein involved in translation (DUF1610 family)